MRIELNDRGEAIIFELGNAAKSLLKNSDLHEVRDYDFQHTCTHTAHPPTATCARHKHFSDTPRAPRALMRTPHTHTHTQEIMKSARYFANQESCLYNSALAFNQMSAIAGGLNDKYVVCACACM